MLQITERTSTGRNHIVRMGEPSDNGAIEKKAKEFFDIFTKCLSPDFEEKYINQMWENTEGLEELEITIFAIRSLALHVFESQNS